MQQNHANIISCNYKSKYYTKRNEEEFIDYKQKLRFESCALPQAVHHNRASVARHEVERANFSLALKRAFSSKY